MIGGEKKPKPVFPEPWARWEKQWLAKEITESELTRLTELEDECPDGWESPCLCRLCLSYAG